MNMTSILRTAAGLYSLNSCRVSGYYSAARVSYLINSFPSSDCIIKQKKKKNPLHKHCDKDTP